MSSIEDDGSRDNDSNDNDVVVKNGGKPAGSIGGLIIEASSLELRRQEGVQGIRRGTAQPNCSM